MLTSAKAQSLGIELFKEAKIVPWFLYLSIGLVELGQMAFHQTIRSL